MHVQSSCIIWVINTQNRLTYSLLQVSGMRVKKTCKAGMWEQACWLSSSLIILIGCLELEDDGLKPEASNSHGGSTVCFRILENQGSQICGEHL